MVKKTICSVEDLPFLSKVGLTATIIKVSTLEMTSVVSMRVWDEASMTDPFFMATEDTCKHILAQPSRTYPKRRNVEQH